MKTRESSLEVQSSTRRDVVESLIGFGLPHTFPASLFIKLSHARMALDQNVELSNAATINGKHYKSMVLCPDKLI